MVNGGVGHRGGALQVALRVEEKKEKCPKIPVLMPSSPSS